MRTMMRSISLLVLTALVAGGCANYKEPARVALQELDYKMQAVGPDAKKYKPEEYAKLQQDYETAKATYAQGDYKETVRQVRQLQANISQVSAAAASAREEMVAQLNQQWTTMSADLPKMVDAIGKRIDSLSKTKKLPKNLTESSLSAAKAGFEDVKKMWDEASQAAASGNVETAVSKGTTIQTKGQEIMSTLGMPPPATA
jgi:predicted  nucleic acid-binding Zn-ribbon protein